ncbi:MAG: chorismate synthase [Planctomycetota bacterium]
MLSRLRFLSAGESHGPRLTAILEGIPAGLALDRAALDAELARRQEGFGSGGRMKIERDEARISGGLLGGRTTGAPLAISIENRDWQNWRERDVPAMTRPRPGHADLTGAIKYGHRDLRLALERASARETATRVAAGAVAKQLLAALGVEVGGYATQTGEVRAALEDTVDPEVYRARFAAARDNDLCCPDPAALGPMRARIAAWRKERDTIGGLLEVVALGLPPGLGSYVQWDRRLEGRLALALLSVPAIKGVEVGPAFANAARRGTEVHDELFLGADGALERRSNRAGGLEGGVTTGMPLVLRCAKKPISTTLAPLRTVDLATGEPAETRYERSDFCALPRAVPIAEAMVALVLADALLEKLGGDSLEELLPRLATLRRARLQDLPMDDAPWRLGCDD